MKICERQKLRFCKVSKWPKYQIWCVEDDTIYEDTYTVHDDSSNSSDSDDKMADVLMTTFG